MKVFQNIFIFLLTVSSFSLLFAQGGSPENWFNLDPEKDGINGVSTERTYKELLKNRSASSVIVAVIDSGVDPEHEDLKRVMWRNPGEVAGNGIDDDGNGYIDDVFGWNFIGGKNGNVHVDTYELTRVYGLLDKKFENVNPSKLTGEDKEKYHDYLKYKEQVNEEIEKASAQVEQFDQILSYITFALNSAKEAMGDGEITQEKIDKLDDAKYGMVKSFFAQLLPQMGGFEGSVQDLEEILVTDMTESLDLAKEKRDIRYNKEFDPRTIVQDDYTDLSQRYYGNSDVKGPDAFHGTHVAGIIAADRTNDVGIAGVADHVQIMSVRTVPDGDERDKDVANAIRYAVDNGANVVNMSFGKGFSPNEKEVEKAIKYAEKNDVLLVHAAGNAGQNNDVEDNFPNATYDKKRGLFGKKKASNWIEVGALSWESEENMVASFSNYGKSSVDVFAPGQQILSTAPDNEYAQASGTSMASPVVAGVAAVLRSYFPDLKAKQIKEIITQSSRPYMGKVRKPGTGELVPFSSLSATGGVINLRTAVMQALITSGKNSSSATKGRA